MNEAGVGAPAVGVERFIYVLSAVEMVAVVLLVALLWWRVG